MTKEQKWRLNIANYLFEVEKYIKKFFLVRGCLKKRKKQI